MARPAISAVAWFKASDASSRRTLINLDSVKQSSIHRFNHCHNHPDYWPAIVSCLAFFRCTPLSCVRRRFLHMGDSEKTVYLEDLIKVRTSGGSPSHAKEDTKDNDDDDDDDQATVTTTVVSTVTTQQGKNPVDGAATAGSTRKAAASSGTKRQRTLMDMFGGTPSVSQTKKKLKLENGEAGPSSTPDGSTSGHDDGLQSLNSVPFSLSAYQADLSDEERDLLALECDTMGKSWCDFL